MLGAGLTLALGLRLGAGLELGLGLGLGAGAAPVKSGHLPGKKFLKILALK